MDEIQISYVVHLLHQAVFGIVGGWVILPRRSWPGTLGNRRTHKPSIWRSGLRFTAVRYPAYFCFCVYTAFAQSSPGEGV